MPEYWASFWEHVDALRHTILRSLMIVGIGFAFLIIFYQPILRFLTNSSAIDSQSPLQTITHQKVQRIQITNHSSHQQLFKLPLNAVLVSDRKPVNHLNNHQNDDLFYQIAPGEALFYEEIAPSSLLIMGPLEGLTLVFKVCLWLSIAGTAPLWGWVWLQFILPGLKDSERLILFPFLSCSLISLALGIGFAHYVTLPLANQSLLAFNDSIGQNAWTLAHYVNYILLVYLGHAIAAELSLLLLLLVHFRFLSVSWLISMRPYMIVIAFILGALLTPPDIFTQLLLAFPLIALYEIAIWYAKWRHRSVNPSRSKRVFGNSNSLYSRLFWHQ